MLFEVWHLESNDGNSDKYYKGKIEADSLDKAIDEFKNEWLDEGYKGRFDEVDYNDDYELRTATYQLDTDYFDENGNDIIDKDKFEEENDISFEESFESGKIGYLDHYYEITQIEEDDQ